MSSLKPIIASLFCLGLISGTASAHYQQSQLDGKSEISRMENALSQNQAGGGVMPDWMNRIIVSGQANFDAYISNRNPTLIGHLDPTSDALDFTDSDIPFGPNASASANDLVVNNLSLFIDASVNEWVTTHVHLLYGQDSPAFIRVSANSAAGAGGFASPIFDEGYVTAGNFAYNPFYLRVGREYVPFGYYNRYAMTNMVQSLTQLLSMTQATAAQIGFADVSGFNGALYIFRGMAYNAFDQASNTTRVHNWGANLGFSNIVDPYNNVGFRASVGYLHNMADVKYVSTSIGNGVFNGLQTGIDTQRVNGLSIDAGFNWSWFDISAGYVTALQTFNALDVVTFRNNTFQGAKPAAWGVDVGFSFPVWNHTSRLGLGYQGSKQSDFLGNPTGSRDLFGAPFFMTGLPKTRWLINYVVELSKCFDLGLEVYNDRAYGRAFLNTLEQEDPTEDDLTLINTGANATTAVIRLGVKFT